MRQILDRAARDGARTLAVMLAIVFALWPAQAHEIYTGLKDDSGMLCCGDSDCEVAEYRIEPTRALFYSRRHRAWIPVGLNKITWRSVPGDTMHAGDAENGQRGHWCGYRRQANGAQPPFHGDDPNFGSYCAFIEPGGS